MLHEITGLKQSHRSQTKRWFSCRDMDLFVWFQCKQPIKFQLAYNKRDKEEVVSWDINHGFHLYRVDTGEDHLDHYKQTPLLMNADFIDSERGKNMNQLAYHFLLASEQIDIEIADFIYRRLMALPANLVKHNAKHRDQNLQR